ncbi:MAG: hypothetical protein KKB13_25415 [Chloroflexi bacterium]|nr:hypothetical protein [Chloroflexota bacterium]MBU1878525.1 hypothetical protein [Chloroflexota bacterium]
MQTYSVETAVSKDGSLVIKGLPLRAGERVQVTVRRKRQRPIQKLYPLRGTPIRYFEPFKSVAEADWEVLS